MHAPDRHAAMTEPGHGTTADDAARWEATAQVRRTRAEGARSALLLRGLTGDESTPPGQAERRRVQQSPADYRHRRTRSGGPPGPVITLPT